ncbi:MAG: putative replicase [Cressdnaviricota sp.]|nr:MAG: putative replicase [Cressdnaviricota sp.]
MERYLGIRCDVVKEDADSLHSLVLKCLQNHGTLVKGTYGHEISLKAKKEHFHFHVLMKFDKVNKYLSKFIKRKFDEENPTNPLVKYAIKVEDKVNENRFFRYPFKDLDTCDRSKQIGFTESELTEMEIQSKTEREISKKQFEKHENKLNNDKTSRKLLWEYLDEQKIDCEIRMEHPYQDAVGDRSYRQVFYEICEAIVEYNVKFNDFKIPMDLKRRAISYMAYKEVGIYFLTQLVIR